MRNKIERARKLFLKATNRPILCHENIIGFQEIILMGTLQGCRNSERRWA
jgi:hypothetical protein